jgi:hypothetical protein
VVLEGYRILLLFRMGQFFEQAEAAIPAEDSIVILGGMNLLRLLEMLHGLLEQADQHLMRPPGSHLSFGSTLINQTGVVVTLVGINQLSKRCLGLGVAVRGLSGKLVGDRQTQHPQRHLVLWFYGQDIVADGFRLFRFVQIPIQGCLGDGFRNAAAGNGFQFQFHRFPLVYDAVRLDQDPCRTFSS